MPYEEIRHPETGRLMGRYDRERDLLEVQDRGRKALFDLRDEVKPRHVDAARKGGYSIPEERAAD